MLGLTLPLPVFLFALACLLAIVRYDLRHMIVPREFYIPFVLSALLYSILTNPSLRELGIVFLTAAVIGGAFLLLFFASGGRAMGLGDAPIAFGLSLLVGGAAVGGLIFSFWIGAVIGIALLVLVPHTRRMGVEVPFVPFLAAGFLLAYFTTWDPFVIVASLMFS
jgi:prepilin signal peptidase PulO-like enzyme (type II secretory pathway)